MSCVDRETHRRFTSADFDMAFWHHQLECPAAPANSPEQLVVAKRPLTCCLCSSRWRLAWLCRHVLSNRLSVCVTSLRHPLASLRVCAMRHLARDGAMTVTVTPAVMHTLVRCLQFADSACDQFRGESTELLLATTSLLSSIFQNNRGAAALFRENEGITTLLSLLRTRFPREESLSPSPREEHLRLQSLRPLLRLLRQLCVAETASCAEVAGLRGFSLLLAPCGDAASQAIALDILRVSLRPLPQTALSLLPRDTLRLLDHLAAPQPRVVAAAAAVVAGIALQPRNARLLRLANGVDVLMRVEETAGMRGGVAAAKALCNLLHGGVSEGVSSQIPPWSSRFSNDRDWCACTRFLRNDIQNCRDFFSGSCSIARFTRGNPSFSTGRSWAFRWSNNQVVALETEIQRFLDIAEKASLFDETVDHASSVDQPIVDSLQRQPSQKETDDDRHVVAHIPTWLGFAANAVRLLAKNGS